MENKEMIKASAYLIALTAAAINGTRPPEIGEDTSFGDVYNLAKMHDILNLTCYSVDRLKNKPEPELYKKWTFKRNQCVHRNLIQTAEYSAIREAFEKNGVSYLPLKGFAVSKLYPKPDYRFMSDLDFLVKKEELKKADEIMVEIGYTVKQKGYANDDKFIKPPFMTVELHHELFSLDSEFYGYYKDAYERAEKVGDFQYRMIPEDFYIYLIVHIYKHFKTAGTGIRSVIDVFFFNRKLLPDLDRDYINRELKKLGVDEFNEQISEIAEKWFGQNPPQEFSNFELYLISSGTFGTTDIKLQNRRNTHKTRFGFYMSILFPSFNHMRDSFPVLRKCPVLLPFMYIYRIIRDVFFGTERMKKEIRYIKEQSKK